MTNVLKYVQMMKWKSYFLSQIQMVTVVIIWQQRSEVLTGNC